MRSRAGKQSRLAAACVAAVITATTPFAVSAAATVGPAPDIYRAAFKAADGGRWDEARSLAARSGDPILTKLMLWRALSRPGTDISFDVVSGFIRENPDWPSMQVLRRRAEIAMPPDLPPNLVRAWFEQNPALTGTGAAQHADALLSTGDREGAAQIVRKFWVEGTFGPQQEREFRERYASLLSVKDDVARLDRLLWDDDRLSAQRMLSVAPPGERTVAEARMAYASQSSKADALYAAVPPALRNHAGLMFERLRAKRRENQDLAAIEILDSAPADLGRPAAWWGERHIMVRRLIEQKDYATAYRLARNHGQTEGLPFSQAEWQAGWIALRLLNQPWPGFQHFDKLYKNVNSPISLARGAYWAGRASEAMGHPAVARQWYETAAGHPTTFYGQIAAGKLGRHGSTLPPQPVPTREEQAAFDRQDMVQVVYLLRRMGRGDEAGPFIKQLAEVTKSPAHYALVTRLAQDYGGRTMALNLAKRAAQNGIVQLAAAYPTLSRVVGAGPESALVHAVIRQESLFNEGARSTAGALGLMQLMPATAKQVAHQLGVKHSDQKLTDDPNHNIRLGSAYLAQMLDRFNGSYVLAVAAYNAGPGRVGGWVNSIGDPRTRDLEGTIDWIESIPIYETRNYVQRVLENLQIYRGQIPGHQKISIEQDLRR